MIKILFYIETLTGGGAEKVLQNLVNHMDQTEFEITVQTAWPCDASKYLAPGIRYLSMYASDSKANRLRYRVEAESGIAYRLHIKDNYDIECAYLEMGSTKVMAASTNQKAKKLAWVHCDLKMALNDPAAFVEKTKRWYQKFDRAVCVSQLVKKHFDELFHGSVSSTVLYNVIDDAAICEQARMPLPGGLQKRRATVLSVGRLAGPKNYLRLLSAHRQLLAEGLEHDLWIVGEGPERGMLEQFVRENRLQDSVFLPGFAENPYPCMKAADLLVCSSSYEGYSTFATEAIVLGKPFLTTDVSGMRELLGDSEYGLIVRNEDSAFVAGMRSLLADSARLKEYSKRASIRGETISLAQRVAETQDFLKRIVRQ